MTQAHIQTGLLGEKIAAEYLSYKGYKITDRNFRCRFGEIDLIATKGNVCSFIEVKTRIGIDKGKPYEAVSKAKYQKILQTAQVYVLKNKLEKYKLTVHVMSVELNSDKSVKHIEHFENVQL